MTRRFDRKHILIAGATSGIGHESALLIAREGGTVIVIGRDPDHLSALRTDLPNHCIVARNDTADRDTGMDVRRIVESSRAFDGLWLNANYADVADMAGKDADGFDRMISANVRGPVRQLAALAGRLTDVASIVVTSSTSSYEGSAMASVHAATKGAL